MAWEIHGLAIPIMCKWKMLEFDQAWPIKSPISSGFQLTQLIKSMMIE